jgi:Uma2 family endonuclease
MTPATTQGLPTHKDLPDSDGSIVENYQESPQSELLVGSLMPRLQQLRPDGQFSIGTDSGIYWRHTDPPLNGCKSPDFFIVLGVPPLLDGELRRSYVLWQEREIPLLAIEYVSRDGAEERDRTPGTGKFWVYEQGIGIPYYLIFDGWRDTLEAYHRRDGVYHRLDPNADGRFAVPELGVEFGLWQGRVRNLDAVWLRVWDSATKALIPSNEEAREAERLRAEAERLRAEAAEGIVDDLRREADEQTEQARKARLEWEAAAALAEQEKQRADLAARRAAELAERLRQLGIDPDAA